MAYPTKPSISTSYTAEEQALGNGTLPGQELDVDFAALRASAEEIIDFVRLFTRSDGKLANGIVTQEALASSIQIGFEAPEPWATATAYNTRSTVFEGYGFYLCLVEHTSGVFATDLAAGRWQLLADLTPPAGALLASNNLSDVDDAAAARANISAQVTVTGAASTIATTNLTASRALVSDGSGKVAVSDVTAAELAVLDGLTATTAELNILDGVTATTAELNILDGVTASTAELNILDGVTADAARINASACEFIATADASSAATVDFTAFNAAKYDGYLFVLANVTPATDGASLYVRTSTDGGSSYDSGASDYTYAVHGFAGPSSTLADANTADAGRIAGSVGNAAGESGVSGSILVSCPHLAKPTCITGTATWIAASGGCAVQVSSNIRASSADVDALRFLFSTGNVASGTITMYGLRNA